MTLQKSLATFKVNKFMGKDSLAVGRDFTRGEIDTFIKTILKTGVLCEEESAKYKYGTPDHVVLKLSYKYPCIIHDDKGVKYQIGVYDKKHPEKAKKLCATIRLSTSYARKSKSDEDWHDEFWLDIHIHGCEWLYGHKDKTIINNPAGVTHLESFDNIKDIAPELYKSISKLKTYIDNGEPLIEEF